MSLWYRSYCKRTSNLEIKRTFEAGSADRKVLGDALQELLSNTQNVPCVIDNQEIFVKEQSFQVNCSDHGHRLCNFSLATEDLVDKAIHGALKAQVSWSRMPFHERAAIFLRAADLISNKYWPQLLASTMIGQGKNAWQAEIDAHAELVDFFRFNCKFAEQIYNGLGQELVSPAGTWNRMEWRALEGFVLAISPFNFTAIGGNLPSAPAIMGNVALWKPSSSAVHSNYLIHKILIEAGLPPGVIQFIPGNPYTIVDTALSHPEFAGLHFTGSTGVFQDLWGKIGANLAKYRSFPRVVGETGGKNAHFVHSSANVENVVNQTIRGAFEYQGQKCSACSRLYVPKSIGLEFRKKIIEKVAQIKQGAFADFSAFMGPVINQAAFNKITGYIEYAKASKDAEVVVGGKYDSSKGYFIEPTVIYTKDPTFKTLNEEIFGPVLTVYEYPDNDFIKTLLDVDHHSDYALTASIFASDRETIMVAGDVLRNAAGNLYINDKCTGAVVGQQPFGGARKSGTNDKAGSALNLLRWVSPRIVKESFNEITDYRYPSNL